MTDHPVEAGGALDPTPRPVDSTGQTDSTSPEGSIYPADSGLPTDHNLLQALASLNEISAAINSMPPEHANLNDALQQIVESAIRVIPNSSAVIYAYDSAQNRFDPELHVWAGSSTPSFFATTPVHPTAPAPGYDPRPNGIGARAVQQRRAVFSYAETDLSIHPLKVAAGARSVACFPMIVAQEPVGALYVYLLEERPFSSLEQLMLENFVHQAALAISHTRHLIMVRRELLRREEELKHLRHTGLLISSRLQLKETLEAILQMALEITNARYGIFRLVDKTGRHLITSAIAGDGLAHPLVEALPISAESVMAQAARSRQPVLIHDLRLPPWSNIYYPLDANVEMRSELAVPLIESSGRLEGVLNLESPRVGAFSEQDSHLLQAMATQAVIAIQESRLLDALLEVAEMLLTEPAQRVLNHLASLAQDLLNADASIIWKLELPDKSVSQSTSEPLLTVLAVNQPAGDPPGEPLSLPDSWSVQAVRQALQDHTQPGRMIFAEKPLVIQTTGHNLQAANVLIAPLFSNSNRQVLGAFSVYNVVPTPRSVASDKLPAAGYSPQTTDDTLQTKDHSASDWDQKVLTCLARYAALAVQTSVHQEALRAAQERHAIAETFAAVGDIAANVLHHLNNKVGTIPVRIQGIQAKSKAALLSDHYLTASLQEIEQNARQALDTVRDSLSHLDPIHLAPVSVAACIQAALQESALPQDIQIIQQGLLDLPPVLASQRGLTLVFTNLLHNAAEAIASEAASPDKEKQIQIFGRLTRVGANGVRPVNAALQPTLRLMDSGSPSWVEIALHDNGPGIPPEIHEQIFELNFSRHTTAPAAATGQNRRPSRLGFGLWWVKASMTRLGGSVEIESDGRNGATFIIRLPAAQGTP